MNQIENSYICYYCLGCVIEESKNFKPKRNCQNFIPAYSNWQERYYKALKGEKNDTDR